MLSDLRHAIRFVLRNPGFSAAVVATLALGIGANSAMYTVVHEVLLRPLPYAEPDRLVKLWETYNGTRNVIAAANYYDWQRRSRSFETTSAFVPEAVNVSNLGDAERVQAARVETTFFDVLRAPAILGRTFVAGDETSGAAVAVVRESFWRSRLGGDTPPIGRTLRLDGDSVEIIGIVPDLVEQPSRETEIWRPLRIPAAQRITRGAHYLQALARLRPGITVAQADQEMRAIGTDLTREHPVTNARVGAGAFSLHDELVRGSRRGLLLIFAATGLLLLLACVNVAHLLLARGAARRVELAVCAALGASRWRLARQIIAESLILAFVGAAVGLFVAMWTTLGIRSVVPDALAEVRRASVNGAVIAFTFGAATLTALVFGLVPALELSSVSLAHVSRAQTTNVSARTGTGRVLITLQVALAVVLVVGAGLLLGSLARLVQVNPGFDSENLVVGRVVLSTRTYPDGASQRRFFRQLLDRLHGVAGVDRAAVATRAPLRAQSANMTFTVDTTPQSDINGVVVQETSPDLVGVLGMTLLQGRELNEADSDRPSAAVVSRAFARRAWGDANPLGRRFRMGPTYINEGHPWLTVVGVIDDIRQHQLAAPPRPQVYLPYGLTMAWPPTEVMVRSQLAPSVVADAIRSAIRDLDRNQPVTSVYTMQDVVRQSVARPRFNAVLLGVFAALAVLLAVVGIYGVISYAVNQRTREIGVRMALGAQRRDVLRLLGRDGLLLVTVGLALGLGSAAILTRALEGMLYEIEPLDVKTYAAAASVMLVSAAIACLVPTLRSTRLDPARVLRAE